jgi:TRAP-type transport system periplasmic protein
MNGFPHPARGTTPRRLPVGAALAANVRGQNPLLQWGIASILQRTLLALCLLLLATSACAKPEFELKFATLAPPGSTWMVLLEEWAAEVRERSEGRLAFKFYPGGIQGDEPDVLKKMRFGQVHGGAFSGHGIGEMYSPARVLELPFLFENFAEIDYVREHFTPRFEEGFRDNGYELLGWMEVGFVHIFSKQPVASVDALKSRRVWLWQGDPLGRAFFNASGISPVPLSIIDVFTSLSTGLIDTVYSTPLASIALQWFTKTDYVSETPLTNAMGALVVSKRFYDRLPRELQALLRETGQETGKRLIEASRIDNDKSMTELRKRGLTVVAASEGMREAELRAISDRAARELMDSGYIPEALIEETRRLIDKQRAQAAAQPVAAP